MKDDGKLSPNQPRVRCCLLDVGILDVKMDSQFAKQFCNMCADICETGVAECNRHDVGHCKRCAQSGRSCAECHAMA